MSGRVRAIGLAFLLLPSVLAKAVPTDGAVPAQEVIKKLVLNATKTPPGAVEDDVTSQVIDTGQKLKKGFGGDQSIREMIAATFNRATLTGPLNCIWSDGPAAIWSARARLTIDGANQCRDEATSSESFTLNGKPIATQKGSAPMFGDSGAFETFVGSNVPADGQVVASFCVVQQRGLWKVHCGYISPGALKKDDQAFIVRCFSAFAKKGQG